MAKILRDLSRNNPDFRLAIVGVGSREHGDDAAGPELIDHLKKAGLPEERVLLVDSGPTPENFTGPLRRFQPDLVILVDVAWMGLPPGSVALLEEDRIGGASALTHGMPLSLLLGYLREELGCKMALLAIQPARTEWGSPMGKEVKQAAKRTAGELAGLYSRKISMYSPSVSS
ncbi:MAG: hydrogenase 3 maturation endopeptidase HyCI [Anaerolineaceae bacterium]